MKDAANEVTEFQGLYGPFTVPEKLIQKIWLRMNFDCGLARTLEGESLEVDFPGRWNLLGGPDFRGARIRFDGREMVGDVEVHFHSADWRRHRHDEDPAYDGVILHVLLFDPPAGSEAARTVSGKRLRQLVLLDLLHHDLEEYAAEDALEASLERNHWQTTERLLVLPLAERRALLVDHAQKRWEQKVHFARLRVERLGWEEACHQAALEILGYRRNRSAMLQVASRFRFRDWNSAEPDEEALQAAGGKWHVQGARPANRPRERLRQYGRWMAARPDWPERVLEAVKEAANGGPIGAGAAGALRKESRMRWLRETWSEELTGGALGGSRLDTFICDGLLPLAAAGGSGDFFGVWFAWFAGDFPDRVRQTLRTAEICGDGGFVVCNGFGQGVLGLSLEQRDDPLACFEGV